MRVPGDNHYKRERHRKWREKVLRREKGLCQICRRYGRVDKNGMPIAATTAHHIKHREDFPELAYKVSNGMALCADCHNKMHPEKGKRYWG